MTLLEQAVSNLVWNAIHHNRPGGHVAVNLEGDGGARFRLRVLDDGPGDAAEIAAELVDRGARGDAARTRDPEGQGLGLDIVRRVADLHGLTLDIGPAEPGGVEVALAGARLPRA